MPSAAFALGHYRDVRVLRFTAATLLSIGLLLGNPHRVLAQDIEQRATMLHLSQTAERSVTRDLLRIELRVDETGADPRIVQTAINRRMAAALDHAHQTPGVRVETGFYNVGEERPATGSARWHGSQSMILSGKDADALLKLAGTLQFDGLSISSLHYEVSPATRDAAQEALTAEALDALDHRAASIAAHIHLAVLRYRDLRVGNAEAEGRPVPRLATMAAAAPMAEPGEATVRVTIEAELLLGGSRP